MTARNGLRQRVYVVGLALALGLSSGCKSAEDKVNDAAIGQAKQQAAATGVPQQVVWTDKNGNQTTVLVQPPAAGQATQQVTTTVAKKEVAGATTTVSNTTTTAMQPAAKVPVATGPVIRPAASGPVVSSAGQNFNGNTSGGQYAANSQQTPDTGPLPAGAYGVGAPSGPSANTSAAAPFSMDVPRGTALAIRINQRIDVKTSRAGERFTGEVARPVSVDGREVIPTGTHVDGVIDASHRRGHFKGRSILGLRLTSMRLNGTSYNLSTRDNVRTKKGKGKRSAAFIGGGTGAGMLIGGLASGGVGLLVGGLAGAGAGTGLAGLTGNRDLVIPAETVMEFRLADDVVVR